MNAFGFLSISTYSYTFLDPAREDDVRRVRHCGPNARRANHATNAHAETETTVYYVRGAQLRVNAVHALCVSARAARRAISLAEVDVFVFTLHITMVFNWSTSIWGRMPSSSKRPTAITACGRPTQSAELANVAPRV